MKIMKNYTQSNYEPRTPEPLAQEQIAPPVVTTAEPSATAFTPANSGTITGTIVDQRGVTWINATITATFRPSPFGTGKPVWTGGPLNFTPPSVKSDGNGFFTMTLPANTAIAPSGSQWMIAFSPDADFQATVIVMSITPGTIDISTFITSQILNPSLIVNAFPIPRVYDPEEARGNPPLNFGALVADTTQRHLKYWDGLLWTPVIASIATVTGTDLDTITTPGSFVVDVAINRPPGTPGDLAFVFVNATPTGGFTIQQYIDGTNVGNNNIYIRKQIAGAWQPWFGFTPELIG